MLRKLSFCSFRIQKCFRTHARSICLFCNDYHGSPRFLRAFCKETDNFITYSTSTEENADEFQNDLERKIIYNSILHKLGFVERKRIDRKEKKLRKKELTKDCTPIALKYITDINGDNSEHQDEIEEPDYILNLPYSKKSVMGNIFIDNKDIQTDLKGVSDNMDIGDLITENPSQFIGNWMNDYEKYVEEEPDEFDLPLWSKDYGTPDNSVPVSQVPCGGCGAHLHCQDPSIPGYLPSEIYKNSDVKDLREAVCQRCHFLKNYNTALSVTVDPEDYPKIISRIENKKALVILIADMTDLPCSVWPGIVDLIGSRQPLFLVGNKIDLIPGDRRGWIRHAHTYLRSCFPRNAIVHHTTLISAKTGFGVEELINKLHNFWQYKDESTIRGSQLDGEDETVSDGEPQTSGEIESLSPGQFIEEVSQQVSLMTDQVTQIHQGLVNTPVQLRAAEYISQINEPTPKSDVYLIGCTNVGKSTLFNSLLQSDYCKVKAVDLIQRATTAPWPGTTLNLLKFPILRPEGWRLYMRTQRLIQQKKMQAAERKLLKQQKMSTKKVFPQLVGLIGRTFSRKRSASEVNAVDNFTTGKPERFGLNPDDPDFTRSKWVYDTPGVLTKEQFLDLLTTEEVSLTVPKAVIKPRTYVMKVGWTLFVAGLARMDYMKGNRNIKVTIFSAPLPVTILRQEHADEVYRELLGTELMSIPRGPIERLNRWPGLEMAQEVNLVGTHSQEACADVTISSAGWVSIAAYADDIIKMSFWSPMGRGVHVRTPSLLPNAVALRGKKINKLPVYDWNRPFIE